MKHYDPPAKHPHAKTPEEEVEPLADPEPDIPPAIHDPDDEPEPDEKADAKDELPIFVPKQRPVLKEIIETRAGIDHIVLGGPHHS